MDGRMDGWTDGRHDPFFVLPTLHAFLLVLAVVLGGVAVPPVDEELWGPRRGRRLLAVCFPISLGFFRDRARAAHSRWAPRPSLCSPVPLSTGLPALTT